MISDTLLALKSFYTAQLSLLLAPGGCCPGVYWHRGGRQKVLGPPAHVPVSDAAQADVQHCSLHSVNVDTLLFAERIWHNLSPSVG